MLNHDIREPAVRRRARGTARAPPSRRPTHDTHDARRGPPLLAKSGGYGKGHTGSPLPCAGFDVARASGQGNEARSGQFAPRSGIGTRIIRNVPSLGRTVATTSDGREPLMLADRHLHTSSYLRRHEDRPAARSRRAGSPARAGSRYGGLSNRSGASPSSSAPAAFASRIWPSGPTLK